LDKVTSNPQSLYTGPTVNFSKLRVLVVDDDAQVFTDVKPLLKDIGFGDIQGCMSTSDAVNQMRISAPDLIILEIQMSGASGINFLRQIRAGAATVVKNVPIVLTSKNLDRTLAFKACEAGIENYISKPIDADNFCRRIKKTVENPIRLAPPKKVERPEHFASPPGEIKSGPVIEAKKADAPPTKPEERKVELAERVPAHPVPNVKVRIALEAKKTAVSDKKSTTPKPQTKPKPIINSLPEKKKAEPKPAEPEIDVSPFLAGHESWLSTKGADGEKANFENLKLPGINLAGQNLTSGIFRGANLQGANLRGAILNDADMRHANLAGADLTAAELHNVKFRHASLKGATLIEAGLRSADLAGADLSGGDLTGVDFKDANFLSTDIRGANMLGISLTQKQINQAYSNSETKLPPGLRMPPKKSHSG